MTRPSDPVMLYNMSYADRPAVRLRLHSPSPIIETGVSYQLDDGEMDTTPGWYLVDVEVLDDQSIRFTSRPDAVAFGHSTAFDVGDVVQVAR